MSYKKETYRGYEIQFWKGAGGARGSVLAVVPELKGVRGPLGAVGLGRNKGIAFDKAKTTLDNLPKKSPAKNYTIADVKAIERKNIALRNGKWDGKPLDIIHYLLLEDANWHKLNNELTVKRAFGPYRTTKYDSGDVHVPLSYGENADKKYKEYKRLGGHAGAEL